MRSLLAATCLTPVALLSAMSPLLAETVVGDARTTPIRTSTATGSAADDIRISSAGSIKPGAAGAAVTLDSNNSVKNEGTISFQGVNNATAILANPGFSGSITNTGTITVDEDYTPTDADNDGDKDGPFAQGSGRFGIRVAPGGTFTGNVSNTGSINIEGNDSAGIAIDSRLAGNLNNGGAINVVGDRSFGIRAGDVTGNVTLTSAVNVQGGNAVGVALDGDIGGALKIQGAIASTGYRSTVAPSDQSKLDADDLLQGGPALRIGGNVAGGILLDVRPADKDDKDDDEDDDGIKDADEGSASIVSYGASPAMVIGAAGENLTIGAVAGDANGHGLVIKGAVAADGIYKSVEGNALVIGGQGGAVNIAGGMTVSGSLAAGAAGANATALRIGDQAIVNEIRNSGSIAASGGGVANSSVRAIAIDAGATVSTIRNSGEIKASRSGSDGTAVAIIDRSGGLTLIETSGNIIATGQGISPDKAIAIDLTANTSGATVRQTAVTSGAAPAIAGTVLFGSGNDVFDVADGFVAGNTNFGAGSNQLLLSGDAVYTGKATFAGGNDTLSLAGTSKYTGDVDFGGGADALNLAGTAAFRGALSGSSGLAVNVAGGSLDVTNTGTVALGSLTVGATGAITINIDPEAGTNTLYTVAGAASFAQGSKVKANLTTVADSVGRFVFLRAGSLSGAAGLASDSTSLPYMFAGSIVTNQVANEVALDIRRKTTEEMEFNGSQTRAYDAVFAALDKDTKVADVFLGIMDGDKFRTTVQQMLPEHAGGAFEAVTQGSRATARLLKDTAGPISDQGGWGFWIQQVAWGTSKDLGDTASYDVSGWGISGGAEIITESFGNVGLSLAYLNGKDADGETENEVVAGQYEAAAYWRANWGGLNAHARLSAAYLDFSGSRFFIGTVGSEAVQRTARGNWKGQLYSASGGLSYEMTMDRFTIRPAVSIDYYRLKENSYAETGGGDAFNLDVGSRKSDEFSASGVLALGYDFARQGKDPDASWLRFELEGGRRQLIGGSLGDTTARFAGGDDFTLVAEERKSGWIGGLRLVGGVTGFRLGGEFNAEEQQGRAAVAFRASLQVGL